MCVCWVCWHVLWRGCRIFFVNVGVVGEFFGVMFGFVVDILGLLASLLASLFATFTGLLATF